MELRPEAKLILGTGVALFGVLALRRIATNYTELSHRGDIAVITNLDTKPLPEATMPPLIEQQAVDIEGVAL